MKALSRVLFTTAVLALAGCASDPAIPASPSVSATDTSDSDHAGRLAQVVTKPGRYTVGVDIEPGFWVGMAQSLMCNYTTIRAVDDVPSISGKLAPSGTPKEFDDNGYPIGYRLSLMFRPGDVLELQANDSLSNMDICQFWNEGIDAAPVPNDSAVPWEDVDRTTREANDWKMGQFDYLDAVEKRVGNFDEAQLTLMGLWACKVKDRGITANTLQHFTHMDSIQADYLITTSYKYMCP